MNIDAGESKQTEVFAAASLFLGQAFANRSDILKELKSFEERLAEEERRTAALDAAYFSTKHSFRRDYGLMLFPFFAFFDSALELVEIDVKNALRSKKRVFSFAFSALDKERQQELQQIFRNWNFNLRNQMEGVEREAAERFVWRLSQFEKKLALYEAPSPLKEAKEDLFFGLRNAARKFFIASGPDWEDAAMTSMGGALGRLAIESLPDAEALYERLKKWRKNLYAAKFMAELDQERENFHQVLQVKTRPLYESICGNLEAAWDKYKEAIQQLRRQTLSFNNALQ